MNSGFKVSYTHMNKTSIKTNAPAQLIWDIMRTWEELHPINEKRVKNQSPGCNILGKKREFVCCLDSHPDSNPESRKMGFLRFQQNPTANWGPGTRATAM